MQQPSFFVRLSQYGLYHLQQGSVKENRGEFRGPCPWCGGGDRFRVICSALGTNIRYWCTVCGRLGDEASFVATAPLPPIPPTPQFFEERREEGIGERSSRPGRPDHATRWRVV